MIDEILSKPRRFLILGDCRKELTELMAAGWKGVAVFPRGTWGKNTLSDDDFYSDIIFIEAELAGEKHFLRTVEGYWVKPFNIADIFSQFGQERFDLIMIDVPMFTRFFWALEEIQSHLPKFYMLKDDGHNKPTCDLAIFRGYRPMKDGEWIIFSKTKEGA